MTNFRPGDVLSYSAGSANSGPEGYRVIRKGGSLVELINKRWPEIYVKMTRGLPFIINAYPAAIGIFDSAVFVDTYLSKKTSSRALQLASQRRQPAILMSQPLIAADFIFHHIKNDYPMPETLILMVGGYVMPNSLQDVICRLCGSLCEDFHLIQGYGAAEVEAGCLLAVERNENGDPIYYPKDNIEVKIANNRLLLSLYSEDGAKIVDNFETGDCAEEYGEGFVIKNAQNRLSKKVSDYIESWRLDDWKKRTGFLCYKEGWRCQLREDERPVKLEEMGFYQFGAEFGFSWLHKPNWTLAGIPMDLRP